jgi:hypothetical protein
MYQIVIMELLLSKTSQITIRFNLILQEILANRVLNRITLFHLKIIRAIKRTAHRLHKIVRKTKT